MSIPQTTIDQWFESRDKPTAAQFYQVWRSFWHKDEPIPIGNIEGLAELLNAISSENSGRRVHLGAGYPPVDLGNNGDVYIDTESSHSFYFKETGTWTLMGKMIEVSVDANNAAEIGSDGKIYVPVPDIPTLDNVLEAGNTSEREIIVPFLKIVDGIGYAWYGIGSVFGGTTGGIRANVNTVSFRNASNDKEAIIYYQGNNIRTILIPDRTGTMAVLLDAFTLSDATWSSNKISSMLGGKQDLIGYTPENSANKKTNLSSPNDIDYPTTKAVNDAITAAAANSNSVGSKLYLFNNY